MRNTLRLTFINDKTEDDLNELWNNCFEGQANLNHINAHIPYPIKQQRELNPFLTRQNGYKTWLIKKIAEQDIIGFVIHGNFFPDHPNNIGFNIGLNYLRNGYATETLSELIEYVRGLDYTETFGHCLESNIGSIRTMESCGFENLGRTGRQFNYNYELKFRIQL